MLGFGSGGAELKTLVKGYLMTAQGMRALGSGEVEAGSGKMPGGAVPLVVTVATANPLGLFVAGAAKAYSEASGSETIEGAANARLTKSPKKLESQPKNRGKSSDAMVEEQSMRNRASRRETAIDRRRLRQYMQQEWRNGRIFESSAEGNDEEGHGTTLISVREAVVNMRSRLRFATVAGTLFAAAAIAATAPAQDKLPAVSDMSQLRPPPGQPMSDADAFGALDGNGDGVIDAAEWRRRKMMIFYILDSDRDLFLVPAEVPGLASSEFAAADSDQDGRLSGYEFNQAEIVQIEFADEDNSRTVTLAEFQSYRTRLARR